MGQSANEMSTPVNPQDIEALRLVIRKKFEKGMAEYQKTGKIPVVLVGDIHIDPKSALFDSLVFNEAKRAGFKDMAIETDLAGMDSTDKIPFMRLAPAGIALTYDQAKYYNTTLHAVDGLASKTVSNLNDLMFGAVVQKMRATYKDFSEDTVITPEMKPAFEKAMGEISGEIAPGGQQSVYMVKERDENIAANLQAIKQPTIMITGRGHIPGLYAALEQKNTVIAFVPPAKRGSLMPGQQEAAMPASVTMLDVNGDVGALSARDIIKLSMGEDAQNFITTMLRKWYATPAKQSPKTPVTLWLVLHMRTRCTKWVTMRKLAKK